MIGQYSGGIAHLMRALFFHVHAFEKEVHAVVCHHFVIEEVLHGGCLDVFCSLAGDQHHSSR